MGANLDAAIDDYADYLYNQSAYNHAYSKAWHVNAVEQYQQGGIAHNADGIRHVAALALAHLVTCPTIQPTVKVNA